MIAQPWKDDRLLMNGKYIGCVTKENADLIMRMQDILILLAEKPETATTLLLHWQARSVLEDLK